MNNNMAYSSILFLAMVACTVSLIPSIGHARDAGDRPNVVVFFLDDSGYGDYAHNGNPTIRTPNISKLVQDGMNFTQFYVTSPACSASRYSLLTGRYPGRSGLGSWVIGPNAQRHIHPKEITLAEGLKTRGYQTGIFGKWHLGTPNKRNQNSQDTLPLAHGFDEWLGTNVSHDYSNAMLLKSDASGTEPIKGYSVIARNLPSEPEICASLTQRSTEAALSFIQRNRAKPFFAYIPFNMPHLGIYASDAFLGKSRRGLLGDVMEEVDDSVGRIRQAIEAAGLAENTLIIFASDNGPWITFQDTATHKKYGEARLHVGYAQPFRDGKGSTWEGGHRVPGIFCWPGKIAPNSVEQSPVSTLDILPTVFALAGVDIPKDRSIDGRDVRPYLMPHAHQTNMPEFEFYYSWSDNKPSAVRVGPWKLHTRISSQTGNNYGFSASRNRPLLFQVEQDLGERIDRAGEQSNRIENMMGKLTTFESQLQKEGSFWTGASAPALKEEIGSRPPAPGVSGLLPAESRQSLKDKKARTHIFADPNYFQWGGSVIRDQHGTYHMFYSRWPRDNPRGMNGWLYESEIARATAIKPEGPYQHQEVVLKGFGQPQPERWDASNAHNPHVVKMKDPVTGKERYYLYFIATRDDDNMQDDWWDQIINQRVGVAVADRLQGPWKRHKEPVVEMPNAVLHHYLVNPGVCQLPDGRFLMVLKGRGTGRDGKPRGYLQGWALADRPEGPFVPQESLLIPSSMLAEDPYVWVQDGWICAVVKDWRGKISGKPGISFVRGKMQADNTVQWSIPKQALVAQKKISWDDGISTKLDRLERPSILVNEEGQPTHLFVAASVKKPGKGPGADLDTLPFNLCVPLVDRVDAPTQTNKELQATR
jgi:arylsulfatase A